MVVAILDHVAIGIARQHGLEMTQSGCFRFPCAAVGQNDRYRHATPNIGINRWPA